MIIGTVTALIIIFGGGGGVDLSHVKDNIHAVVQDGTRAEQLETVIGEWQNLRAAFDKELKIRGEQVSQLNQSYDSTLAQYDALMDEGMKTTVAARTRFLDLRFKAKDLMSEEEWIAVFATPAEEEN